MKPSFQLILAVTLILLLPYQSMAESSAPTIKESDLHGTWISVGMNPYILLEYPKGETLACLLC